VSASAEAGSDGVRPAAGGLVVRRVAQVGSVVFVLALLGVLVWDVTHSSAGRIASAVDSQKAVPAYLFSRPQVGKPGTLSLSAYRGRDVVVLNFWQSYCPPCTAEARTVSAVSKQWVGKGVVFLGVDVQDLPGPATAFMRRFDITYPVVSDDGNLVGRYGVTGYPETFFIDRRDEVIPMPPVRDSGCSCTQVGHIIGQASPVMLDAGIRAALTR
jgi:thiol-disulfide isomerase/thioredoxin